MIYHGAKAIAERLNMTPRQVYRLVDQDELPFIVRLGRRMAASETAIRTFFKEDSGLAQSETVENSPN